MEYTIHKYVLIRVQLPVTTYTINKLPLQYSDLFNVALTRSAVQSKLRVILCILRTS